MQKNKLNKLILLAVAFASVFSANAQLLPISYDTTEISHEIIIDGGVDYYSTAIEKDITSKFIRGGVITNDIKDNSFAKHGAINRFGGIGAGSIEYRNYKTKIFKKKNWGFLVKGGYNAFFGMLYSKDLFGIAMYGNERYRGETIDISGTNMSFMAYQKLGFGLIDAKTKSNISFNFYNISNRTSAQLRTFELTQDLAGDNIEIVMDGSVELSSSKKFNQGIGFGVDLDFKIPIQWGKDDNTAYIQFQAQNVGFAYMYEKQQVYTFDTTFTFSGLNLDQLVGDNALFGDSISVLDSLGIRSTEKNRTVLLPGFIQIGKIVDALSPKKLQSFFGMRLYPTLIYSPFIYAGLDFKPKKWLHLGINASYGGFGKLKGGIYASVRFSDYSIGIATENVVGFVSKKANGESLFIKLRWAI
ncbi:MAG: hypothetical protein COA33_003755 [Fluviicola sp.]|nr:hypothetical protein [Fluviicola sp.]